MAEPHKPNQVKLIVGLLAGSVELLDAARTRLTEFYGTADLCSDVIEFDFTEYYRDQMGKNLKRQFLAFEQLIEADTLSDIKLQTNAIETEFQSPGNCVSRPVNIDPGYVHSAKLVLASAKDFAHRIYLRDGIFAEITLQYRSGKWESSPWTFPDYGSGKYDKFLSAARDKLKAQIGQKP